MSERRHAPQIEASPPMRRRLLLSGFMGTGKSTIGRRLAALTGARFDDLDAVVEAQAGRSIPDIFAEEGEARFRQLERAALVEALAGPDEASPLRVVALGGGALIDDRSRTLAIRRAFLVTLSASPHTIVARCRHGDRPLLAGRSPAEMAARVTALMTARASIYEAGHLHVRTDDEPPEVLAGRLATHWRASHR